MKNLKQKILSGLVVLAMLHLTTLFAAPLPWQQEDPTAKEKAKTGTKQVGEGAKEVGKGTKNVAVGGAKVVGQGAKKGGKAVGKGARAVGNTTRKGAKKIDNAVSDDKD
jgi:hypothetical protein